MSFLMMSFLMMSFMMMSFMMILIHDDVIQEYFHLLVSTVAAHVPIYSFSRNYCYCKHSVYILYRLGLGHRLGNIIIAINGLVIL